MDPKEASLYQFYLIILAVIIALAIYYIVSAIRFRTKYRNAYDARLGQEIMKLEAEKNRISQDLHDDITPVLTAIKMNLECIEPSSAKENQTVEKCILHLDNLTSRLRNISIELMPAVLKDKGLAIAIEQYIHSLSTKYLEIEYSYDTLPVIDTQKALHIFRIVQEIIHNTLKHADASKFWITLSIEEKRMVIATADDGKGFVYDSSGTGKSGYGISNIHSRTEALNAVLNIESRPGKGTRYYIEVPID